MKCLNCKNPIIVKKNIKNLFQPITIHICQTCLKKYPINIKHEIFPTIKGQVFVFTILNNASGIKEYSAYMGHLAQFYKWFLGKRGIILIYDEVNWQLLEVLQDISFGDILLITHKNEN